MINIKTVEYTDQKLTDDNIIAIFYNDKKVIMKEGAENG